MNLPRDPYPDATISLLREGYQFISNRCERMGSEGFRTRLMLRPVTCLRGRDAADIFYDEHLFTRDRTTPANTVALFQRGKSARNAYGEDHRHRKRLLMDLMDDASLDRMSDCFRTRWRERVDSWTGPVRLYDEVRLVLTAAALDWMGIEADATCIERRNSEFSEPIGRAGSFLSFAPGMRFLKRRSERWAMGIVRKLRRDQAPCETPVARFANHRDLEGALLAERRAAVEILNLLRPVGTVARLIAFGALELHRHRAWQDRIRNGAPPRSFVQEVRRTTPFFPLIGGRVRRSFDWHDVRFRKGDWVILDLYGTNRDASVWDDPETFRPERFDAGQSADDDLIAQGSGDHFAGHRCAGEWMTIRLMEDAMRMLSSMGYQVPEQDLTVDLKEVPALPRSGFVIHPRTIV